VPYRGRPGLTIDETPPSLEDVFVNLMQQADAHA